MDGEKYAPKNSNTRLATLHCVYMLSQPYGIFSKVIRQHYWKRKIQQISIQPPCQGILCGICFPFLWSAERAGCMPWQNGQSLSATFEVCNLYWAHLIGAWLNLLLSFFPRCLDLYLSDQVKNKKKATICSCFTEELLHTLQSVAALQ